MSTLVLTFILLVAIATGANAADNLPIKAFYGHFVGAGQASSLQGGFFNVTDRDLDVTIEPVDGGVRIAWTTFLRKGADPASQEVIKRSTKITFKKTGNPNVFIEKRGVDPFDDTPLSWARIDGRTLTTYTLVVDKNGVYTVASYARTLNGQGKKMELLYKAFQDGEWVRSAKADLVRK
jgi:hypothetical protein